MFYRPGFRPMRAHPHSYYLEHERTPGTHLLMLEDPCPPKEEPWMDSEEALTIDRVLGFDLTERDMIVVEE